VRLNLGNAHEVRAAAGALSRLGSGLYVEQMVTGVVAELIVGITDDPQFGPALTIGSGGVLVELLQDTQTLLLPATRGEIEAALRKLRMFPLLDGYRGRARGDVAAAIEAIAGIADFAVANKDSIAELDINPLLVRASGKGVGIADALISARGEL
jgi:acetate---CoA ligase (ADP-forming)